MLKHVNHTLDPWFPTLAQALDPASVAEILRGELARTGFATGSLAVEIERVRLKPGRKALIGYRLFGERPDGEPIDQRAMLTLWPRGSVSQLPVVEGSAATTPEFGPATLESRALRGTAWFFPNDRKVKGIGELIEDARSLGRDCEIVHYVPEQGCTVSVAGADKLLYGKARVDGRCATAVHIAHFAAEQKLEGVRIAPVIAYDRDRRIMWQEEVAGAPLSTTDLVADTELWSARIASAIAAFHGLEPRFEIERLTSSSILGRLRARAVRIETAIPSLAADLADLMARLAMQVPTQSRLVLSHGDLHPANLLWDGESFALIDLDTSALAPAALDHASFAAAVAQKLLAHERRPDRAHEVIAALRREALAREDIAAQDYAWHLASCLVGERLYRCGTRLKAGYPQMPEHLLELAVRALSELDRSDG